MKQMTFCQRRVRRQAQANPPGDIPDREIRWCRGGLIALIEPHYPKGEGGRPAYPLMVMLRAHLMPSRFCYSDPAMEQVLYETTCFQGSALIAFLTKRPSSTFVVLEKNELVAGILAVINGHDVISRRSSRSSGSRDAVEQPVQFASFKIGVCQYVVLASTKDSGRNPRYSGRPLTPDGGGAVRDDATSQQACGYSPA